MKNNRGGEILMELHSFLFLEISSHCFDVATTLFKLIIAFVASLDQVGCFSIWNICSLSGGPETSVNDSLRVGLQSNRRMGHTLASFNLGSSSYQSSEATTAQASIRDSHPNNYPGFWTGSCSLYRCYFTAPVTAR